MLTKRIIPCLDVKNGNVVKGIHFLGLKEVGDPVALAKKYYLDGADELVFLDISATVEKRKTMVDIVKKVAKEINKMATTSTRNAGKVTKGQSGISESERDSKIQEAQARAQKAKPGSLTSKANLVSRYNQGLETAEPKVESAEKDSKKKKR